MKKMETGKTECVGVSVSMQNDDGCNQEHHNKILQMRALLEKHDPTSKVFFFFSFSFFSLSHKEKQMQCYGWVMNQDKSKTSCKKSFYFFWRSIILL